MSSQKKIIKKIKSIGGIIVYGYLKPWIEYINIKKFIFLWHYFPSLAIAVSHYQDLIGARKYFSDSEYKNLTRSLFERNKKVIQKKKTIKVWLMIFLDSVWACDQLYRFFEESNRFEPTVVLMNIMDDENNERNRKYIEGKKYRYISSKDIESGRKEADIIMYSTLYDYNTKGINVGDRKLGALIFCIPYTFWWEKTSDSLLHNHNSSVCWRFYAPTKIHMQLGIEQNVIGSQIMRYSGYPKLESFANGKHIESKNGKKTIIYAPGYYSSDEDSNFSTFDLNAFEIYQLAKSTEDVINWIYRPHPRLEWSLENAKVMNWTDYQTYEERWKTIKNVHISIGGSYQDIFLMSDAIITDAISFVSTYQYVKNPMLFIDRHKGKGLNEFGLELHKVIYHIEVNDINGMKRFIEDVVIGGQDTLKEQRDAFFKEYLDFYSENHCSASEFIYNDICKSILEVE